MKYLLVVVIAFLLLWMVILLREVNGLTFALLGPQAMLFVGLAILAGSSLIALCVQKSSHDAKLYRTYCKVTAELEKGPLTREELGEKIGSKRGPFLEIDSTETPTFSRHQLVFLERLLYEEKIIERRGKLSLPS